MAILIKAKSGDLLLINVYLPPGQTINSSITIWQQLDLYITEATLNYTYASIILMGDFNSRCDDTMLMAYHFWKWGDCTDGAPVPNRFPKDKAINSSGVQLLYLTRISELTILNGAIPPDIPGEYMFLSSWGSSVVDYVMFSESILPYVTSFEVGEQIFSDHFPMFIYLDLPQERRDNLFPCVFDDSSTNLSCKIKWSKKVESEISMFYDSPEGRNLYSSIVQAHLGPQTITAYAKLEDALIQKFSRLSKSQSPHAHCKRATNNWFDSRCRALCKQLKNIYREHRSGSEQFLPPIYFQIKKAYKNSLKFAKHQVLRNAWNKLIMATNNKDSHTFWRIFSVTSRVNMPCRISARSWETHFFAVYNNAQRSQVFTPSLIDVLPRWPPIKSCRNNKLSRMFKNWKSPWSRPYCS
ncbi:uncharacterized protein LOC128347008 [Hemicordylus capensis]|uniref:uncharacterized protein LOC128347008 n=1 Tax=Hemicordylus capensis TaxID=884348 RepID=UPI002304063F|nr:uncharacterized protein LOC128347008 [Hemicordylus capensis]